MISGFLGCDNKQITNDSPILAKVGNDILYLDTVISNIPHSILSGDSSAAVNSYRDNWVNDRILYQEAVRLGLGNTNQVKRRIERSMQDILVEALREQIILNNSGRLDVSNDEIRSFYEANRDQFVLQERHIRIRHFSSESLLIAQEAKSELLRGAEWDDVVEAFAIDKEGSRSLEKQLIPVSAALKDFPNVSLYLNVIGLNEISPIRRDGEYYHFVQIVEDRPRGDHPDLEWVFGQIHDWLVIEKTRRAIKVYEQNLYLQAEANNEVQIY